MTGKKITYERDVHKSYMKIAAMNSESMDEKLMLRKKYHGILPVEKCYVNGGGEYWYNISGKQALDVYCQENSISHEFFERLILKICNQLELLEWNLMDSSCLIVEPEYIFVNHTGEEVSFVLYPDTSQNIYEQLQMLAEYLLTKIKHNDRDGVHTVYQIYEMLLAKKYSISDLKNMVLEMREHTMKVIIPCPQNIEIEEEPFLEIEKKENAIPCMKEKLQEILEQIRKRLWKKENKEQVPDIVYPYEVSEENSLEIHPTVCLTAGVDGPKGLLIYEGRENYPDFQLNSDSCVVGKNPRVKLYIDRETISQFHAKIEFLNNIYYIEDMNSTNGTFVNEKVLNYKEKQQLFSGDVIRFADVKYRFL